MTDQAQVAAGVQRAIAAYAQAIDDKRRRRRHRDVRARGRRRHRRQRARGARAAPRPRAGDRHHAPHHEQHAAHELVRRRGDGGDRPRRPLAHRRLERRARRPLPRRPAPRGRQLVVRPARSSPSRASARAPDPLRTASSRGRRPAEPESRRRPFEGSRRLTTRRARSGAGRADATRAGRCRTGWRRPSSFRQDGRAPSGAAPSPHGWPFVSRRLGATVSMVYEAGLREAEALDVVVPVHADVVVVERDPRDLLVPDR